jgi:dienelactone hydrolase
MVMKRFTAILILSICIFSAGAQSYLTGKRSVIFIDFGRNNRVVTTDLFYPANIAGNNVALASGSEKFPVIVFGHGFLIGTASYNWLADSLVKYGYIVAMPSTESGISPNHGNFGEDLAFLCQRITSLNDSASSFLFQRLIKKAAVGGHSMGGGASFLSAAGLRPSIYALFNFAAAETNPSATQAALQNQKPALVFSGSSDCIVLPSVQEAMYNNIPLACKTYINITSGLHCQFANNNSTCSLGQLTSGCNSSPLNTTIVFTKTMSLIVPFVDYYLKDICTRGEAFINTYNNITGVTKRQSCNAIPSCGPLPLTVEYFRGMNNDKIHNLTWKVNCVSSPRATMTLERSANGLSFSSFYNITAEAIRCLQPFESIDAYPLTGINYYRLKLTDADGNTSYSNIIKLLNKNSGFDILGILPNPVIENGLAILNIMSSQKMKLQIVISDMEGRKLSVKSEELVAGINQIQLNLFNLSAGIYQVNAFVNNGDSKTTRVVKK